MLRSLAAAMAATFAGLMTARLFEAIALAAIAAPDADRAAASTVYAIILVAGWGVGAFAAAGAALLVGRRWAPLGWLGAATVGLLAGLGLSASGLAFWTWPAAFVAIAAGGFAAVRWMRASARPIAPGLSGGSDAGSSGLFS